MFRGFACLLRSLDRPKSVRVQLSTCRILVLVSVPVWILAGCGGYGTNDGVTVEANGITESGSTTWIGNEVLVADLSSSEPGRNLALEAAVEGRRFGPDCLPKLFEGATGSVKSHIIPLNFMGRIAVGDLDSDGYADFVVSNRDKLAAYNICGEMLWQKEASTHWDHPSHVYWNWTSYGYIGDADGDGRGEFLHLGSDWRTLYIRNGTTGVTKQKIVLPKGPKYNKWMYVGLARRPGETGETATRVVASVMSSNGYDVVSYDIRAGRVKKEWAYRASIAKAGINAYAPPWTVDLDGRDGDEIVFGSVALTGLGREIWAFNPNMLSVLGVHTLSVRDIDPLSPGLEAVISLYGPNKGQPSLVSYKDAYRPKENWRAFSPYRQLHAHQHTVGDFDLNSPGLETIARNGDGRNHWMVDLNGKVIRRDLRIDPGVNWGYAGQIIQGIEWDHKPGTELLYVERHVRRRIMPRFLVTSTHSNSTLTPVFHGGDGSPVDDWYGEDRRSAGYHDGPYEGAAHAVDLIGDGREEILTWGANKITIYYNSGHANVAKRWGDADYMQIKKIWCAVYNPR